MESVSANNATTLVIIGIIAVSLGIARIKYNAFPGDKREKVKLNRNLLPNKNIEVITKDALRELFGENKIVQFTNVKIDNNEIVAEAYIIDRNKGKWNGLQKKIRFRGEIDANNVYHLKEVDGETNSIDIGALVPEISDIYQLPKFQENAYIRSWGLQNVDVKW